MHLPLSTNLYYLKTPKTAIMEIGEMINQNKALMQLLMQNQCYLEIIIEDVAEKIQLDFADDPEKLISMMEIRRQMAENYYRGSLSEVKAIIADK
jgi:hypothetical protein